jgi:hypothetical protein
MSETLVRALADSIERRSVLLKVALGATAGIVTLMGLQTKAAAYDYACCTLCQAPGSCTYACAWCWNCPEAGNPTHCWRCCEGYSAGAACMGGCSGNICSWAFTVGGPC